MIGTLTSANRCVLAFVVAPAALPTEVLTVDSYILKVVATELTAAAEATTLNLTDCIKVPLVPVARTEYIKSVPDPADVPSDLT